MKAEDYCSNYKKGMKTKNKIESLQVLRAVAFTGIFIYHAIRTFPGRGRVYHYISTGPGPWGVSVFFVLSGFLMTYSYWDREPERSLKGMVLFAVKKIKKLYPLHLIMLFFGVVYSLKNGADPQGFFKLLLKTVLLIQTWFSVGYQVFNTVAWYLSVSLFLYFMFPLVLPLVKRGSFKESAFRIVLVYLIQLSIGYYISRYTGYEVKWAAYCHPLYRLGDFLEGALTASSFIKIQKTNRRKGRLFSKRMCSALEIIAVVSNIAVCASYSRVAERAQWFAFTCLFAPVSLLLVYAFSLNNGILSDFLKKRIIYWLAAISPYGFLIHRLVIYYFYDFVVEVMHRKSLPYMVEIAVPFAITVAGVYLYLLAVKIVAGWKRAV